MKLKLFLSYINTE